MEHNVVIIEDEPNAQQHLVKLLKRQNLATRSIVCLATVSDTVKWLKNNPIPDLVFMDVQLSDGLSFDILDQITIACPIIFTTAYDQYAVKAFKTTGIDYLLKPITLDDMTKAVKKYQKMVSQPYTDWMLKNLDALTHFQQKGEIAYKERFLLRSGNALIPVPTNHIAYFFREEIVFAKTFDQKVYPVDASLNQLQTQLNPIRFVRLSRKLLVQVSAIVQLQNSRPGQFMLALNPSYHEPVQISQERSSWLKRFLDADF